MLLLALGCAAGFPEDFKVVMEGSIHLANGWDGENVPFKAVFSCTGVWSLVKIIEHQRKRQLQSLANLEISVKTVFEQAERGFGDMKLVIEQLVEADSESLILSEPETAWEAAKRRGLPDDVCGLLYPPNVNRLFRFLSQRCERRCIVVPIFVALVAIC